MKRAMHVGLVLGLGLGLSSAAAAETIAKESAGVTQTVQCKGRDFDLNGADNNYTLLGECPSVAINGMGNTVRVESVKSITINGMNNKVVWGSALAGSKPKVSNNGLGNDVRKGEVGSGSGTRSEKPAVGEAATQEVKAPEVASRTENTGPAIEITGHHLRRKIECGGRDATISGGHNKVILTGECGTVAVTGSHNDLKIEAAGKISLLGGYNDVTWQRGTDGAKPKVSNLGHRNEISQSAD